MPKFILFFFMLIFNVHLVNGQIIDNFYSSKINQNKPFLINRVFSNDDDGGERLFHTLEQIQQAFQDDTDFSLALRVCSSQPLSVVFTSIDYSPRHTGLLIKTQFQSFTAGINVDKVFLLTTKANDQTCSDNKKKLITEYWLIPKNSDFPDFDEIGKLADYDDSLKVNSAKYERKVIVESFKLDGDIFTSEQYAKIDSLTPATESTFKADLLKLLRADRLSFLLIQYPNYGKSVKAAFGKALQIKRFLLKNYIRSKRIILSQCETNECNFDDAAKYPVYPNISVVRQK